jgi:SAM-dependent methyltransferase
MSELAQRFDDGAAYEGYMGAWSRLVGEDFLAWLDAAPGQRWADIGCGNGCFTEQILAVAAPASVDALDPSADQLAHAEARLRGRAVRLRRGDAMALPFDDAAFDVVAMALVIHFVPDPARALAEMIRVTRPGGVVATYVWDLPGGGSPFAALPEALAEFGLAMPRPPTPGVTALPALEALWRSAGLEAVEARSFSVHRRYPDFETYWSTWQAGPQRMEVPPAQQPDLQRRLRDLLGCDETGPFTVRARASAVRGRVPG